MIQKLMVHSDGLTGKITTLLAQAAELAIRQKTESISLVSDRFDRMGLLECSLDLVLYLLQPR